MQNRGRPDSVDPGRPLSLPTDDADATTLLGIVQQVAAAGGHVHDTARKKLVRESIWYLWEEPRLPRPRIAGKYPLAYPWSERARAVAEASEHRPPGGWGLVIEHVHPIRNLVAAVLDSAPTLTVTDLKRVLRDGLASAVITKDEDAQLTRAGVATLDVPPGDLWYRYRLAGLDVRTFGPLGARD